jgi:hypothetical protein
VAAAAAAAIASKPRPSHRIAFKTQTVADWKWHGAGQDALCREVGTAHRRVRGVRGGRALAPPELLLLLRLLRLRRLWRRGGGSLAGLFWHLAVPAAASVPAGPGGGAGTQVG